MELMGVKDTADKRRGLRIAALAVAIALVTLLIVHGSEPLDPGEAQAASGGVEMTLDIIAGSGGFCDGNDCIAGSSFMLRVTLEQAPPSGYIVMQTFLDFGTYDPTASEDGDGPNSCSDGRDNANIFQLDGADRRDSECASAALSFSLAADPTENIVWPDWRSNAGGITEFGPGLLHLTALTGPLLQAPSTSNYAGPVVELEMTCPATPVQTSLAILPEGHPFALTNGALLSEPDGTHVNVKVDAITIDCVSQETDTDGDGCTDWYEMGPNPELGGLNDPFDPTDCDGLPGGVDEMYSYGLHEFSHEFTYNTAAGYRVCKLNVMQYFGTSVNVAKIYCYTDVPGVDINPEAYPGTSGDGLPGEPPPGPEHPGPGSGNLAFGDVDGSHAVLAGPIVGGTLVNGRYVGGTAHLQGCINDQDGQDPLGHVIVRWEWDVQTGVGTSEIWTDQAVEDCVYPPTPVGTPETKPLQVIKLATTAQSDACYTTDPACPFSDTDGDGAPDAAELWDDELCGRRDPFNPYDYYDVSQPRDGIIDFPNDVMGVILHMSSGGYPEGEGWENWDRPGIMTNVIDTSGTPGGHWNRGSPDGVIDVANDLIGVQLQINITGC